MTRGLNTANSLSALTLLGNFSQLLSQRLGELSAAMHGTPLAETMLLIGRTAI
jgi:hypothetical protein